MPESKSLKPDSPDPSMTDIPKMVPLKDDIDQRKQSVERRRSSRRIESQPTSAQESKIWGWFIIVFLLLAVTIGLARWIYVLQIQQDGALHMLDLARDRITSVEGRLSTTDDSANKSGVVMQVQIKELKDKTDLLWEQMDKLWASAWRRNQKDLEDQQQALKKLAAKVDNQQKLLNSSQSKLLENKEKIEKTNEQIASISTLPNELSQLKQQQQAELELRRQATDTINTLSAKQNALSSRVKSNEEWVESINGYRRQLNVTIEDIQQNINQLQSLNSSGAKSNSTEAQAPAMQPIRTE